MSDSKRIKRLVQVAKSYYIDNQRQQDIASELGVSRPLISRMLSDAKDLGIVEIIIHDPDEVKNQLSKTIIDKYGLESITLIPDAFDDRATNQALAKATFEMLDTLEYKNMGMGWGHFIGQMVDYLELNQGINLDVKHIFPLIGNAGISIRNYHSNENVRIFASHLNAQAHFLPLPALAENLEEKNLFCSTETYQQIVSLWESMDLALVNIGNYPSTPDFASVARYGQLLQKKKASGRLLAYFYNTQGEIIESDQDFVIQIPLALLKQSKHVVGLCSANTNLQALKGALNTGVFTHLVVRETLLKELVETE